MAVRKRIYGLRQTQNAGNVALSANSVINKQKNINRCRQMRMVGFVCQCHVNSVMVSTLSYFNNVLLMLFQRWIPTSSLFRELDYVETAVEML